MKEIKYVPFEEVIEQATYIRKSTKGLSDLELIQASLELHKEWGLFPNLKEAEEYFYNIGIANKDANQILKYLFGSIC